MPKQKLKIDCFQYYIFEYHVFSNTVYFEYLRFEYHLFEYLYPDQFPEARFRARTTA